jgi:regulator of sigma E protease
VITIILGLLVFSALVIIHELGHFLVARRLGVRVERFSVGFGPVIFSRKVNGVEIAVSAFPLGGYVKMGGDDPRDRTALKSDDFFAAAWWRRVLIALAGPGANFVLAIVVSIVLAWVGVRLPDAPNVIGGVTAGSAADSVGLRAEDRLTAVDGTPVASLQAFYQEIGDRLEEDQSGPDMALTVARAEGPTTILVPRARTAAVIQGLEFPMPAVVGDVIRGTPAYQAGLLEGDRITAIDGAPVRVWSDMTRLILKSPGKEIELSIERDGRTLTLPITPMSDSSGDSTVGRIGIGPVVQSTYLVRFGFLDGIVQGTGGALATVAETARSIGMLFTTPSNLSQLSGPVAIIQASGDAAQRGWDRLLNLGVWLSVALMVFNLLPIPILDGGMVVLSVVEAMRGRPLGNRGLTIYQGIGIAVLGTLFLFVLINDPLRILQRHSALGRLGDTAP